jgi:hypothetical protein
MNSMKRLATSMTGAVAIAALVGTSAFAESRHSDATNDRREQRSERSSESRDHGRGQADARRGGDSSSRTQPEVNRSNNDRGQNSTTYRDSNRGRSQNDTYRNNNGAAQAEAYRNNRGAAPSEAYRNNGATQSEAYRNNNRGRTQYESNRNERGRTENQSYRNGGSNYRNGGSNYRNGGSNYRNNRPAYDSRGRRNVSIGGRINRFLHERGGYRIWIDGGRYPIWIPEARISLFPRLRVGLSLNFGGYYDPLGYLEAYDYYDGAAYGYGGAAYSSGLLRGVVETVDYRRGTLVLRDENTGNFVTALIRDRRMESLRPGDYAEISGDWTRGGVFEGLRLENVDGGRY